MATVEIGSTWKRAGRLGIYEVDRLNASQARLRNVKTRRTELVGLSRLCENWQRIDAPAAPPAQSSALERAAQALKLMTVPPNIGKVDAVLLALVSEVRAEEREACISVASGSCVCATDAAAGCGCSACKTAAGIRARNA